MADKIYTLQVAPGIKRDGTSFESREFTAGEWSRFQRGTPRKCGGYRSMFADPTYTPRGLIAQSSNGTNYTFVGNAGGINAFTNTTTVGVGYGPYAVTVGNETFSVAVNTIPSNNTVTLKGDQTSTGTNLFIAGGTLIVFSTTAKQDYLYTVVSSTYSSSTGLTTVVVTPQSGSPTIVPGTPTTGEIKPAIVLANQANRYDGSSDVYSWNFDINYSPSGSSYNLIAHGPSNLPNVDNTIPSQVYVGSLIPTVVDSFETWNMEGLRDTTGSAPTGAPISVDGGVCVLYPFIFVYGSNGFIANNHVTTFNADTPGTYGQITFTDWNGPTANQINVAAGKILKGMPVRGGTNSPSGLFWATNALIRVSFTGQAPLYWSNDLISTDCTLISPNAVVEQNGVYYWMGTEQFYLYNGTVQPLQNDKNINWVYDNLNQNARSKVWGISIKRFNEVWWFYPRGTATECTDVVIYNTKDKIWYDLGEALGCRRSCGWQAELFPYPIMAGYDFELLTGTAYTIANVTSGLTFSVNGAILPNLPGTYMSLVPDTRGKRLFSDTYDNNTNTTTLTFDSAFNPAPAVGDRIYQILGGYPIWQHEYGYDRVFYDIITAIRSSIETCDISFVGGDPSQDTSVGLNRRIKLFRVEPDFVQEGPMQLQIVGRGYARGPEQYTEKYTFYPETDKVDLQVENREMRLIFTSDALNGTYQMGRILIIAEPGDERA